jgi:hypothetical protein
MKSATFSHPQAQVKTLRADRTGELRQFAFLAIVLVLEFTTMLVG